MGASYEQLLKDNKSGGNSLHFNQYDPFCYLHSKTDFKVDHVDYTKLLMEMIKADDFLKGHDKRVKVAPLFGETVIFPIVARRAFFNHFERVEGEPGEFRRIRGELDDDDM